MPTREELEQLTSKELHDKAVHRAKTHLDVKFFWRLMEALPIAEAAAGEVDKAEMDLQSTVAHVDDITDAGEGETAELLRPLYVDYLADD
jgi:hypothetical protein